MGNPISGGGNKMYWYRVRKNTGGTAYVIKTADGSGTAATTADALKVLTFSKSVKPAPSAGTVKLAIENYEDSEALDAVLKEFAQPVKGGGSSTLPKVKWQDGVEYGGTGGSTSDIILCIYYGPLDTAAGKRKTWVALGNIVDTSGASDDNADDYTKPTLEFQSIYGDFDLSIIEALFDGAMVKVGSGGIGAQTLDSDLGFERKWLLKP